jgi:hypothetical protein
VTNVDGHTGLKRAAEDEDTGSYARWTAYTTTLKLSDAIHHYVFDFASDLTWMAKGEQGRHVLFGHQAIQDVESLVIALLGPAHLNDALGGLQDSWEPSNAQKDICTSIKEFNLDPFALAARNAVTPRPLHRSTSSLTNTSPAHNSTIATPNSDPLPLALSLTEYNELLVEK